MSSLSRKLKRKNKKDSEKEFKNKVGLFNKIPENCLTCDKPFDKKNKEMVMTWSVVVADEETVRLYCPDCWNRANKLVAKLKEEKDGS